MLCLGPRDKPIRLPDEGSESDFVLEEVYALDEKVLAVAPPSEEEMQTRLKDLRQAIAEAKLDWYVVPSQDEHMSEYTADSDKRRDWISGFDGSAGTALVPSAGIEGDALLFVDSRYWILAERMVPKKGWKVVRVGATGGNGDAAVAGGWTEYVSNDLPDGSRIGIDPKLISVDFARTIEARLSVVNTRLIPLNENLVDVVHTPAPRSLNPLAHYPYTLSGEKTDAKLKRIRAQLTKYTHSDQWIYLLPTITTIPWLLNYRGSDVEYTPVAFAYCVITATDCALFVDKRKVQGDDEMLADFENAGVTLKAYGVDEVQKFVQASVKAVGGKKAQIFAARTSSWALAKACEPAHVNTIACPVDEAKVLKNPVELQNFRNAYLRDGRAMARWMAWLENRLVKEGKDVGEWAAAMVLARYRRQEDMYAGLAYGDISATGPNAASGHYAPSRGNEAQIDITTPYVIDSGPQYLDATIDTTRTLFMGKDASADLKRQYTRVLQGYLAVANATFPLGADASGLNAFSRKHLWEDGLDFGHGLGHGVANYGTVHEFPTGFVHGFSYKPGHVTTIEPGFYLEGKYGMRIESTFICKEVETQFEFATKWLGFECVTRVPIDNRLVDWNLLTKDEIKSLNEYNKMVEDALLPLLDDDLDKDARDWVKKMCKPHFIWPWTGKQ
ncbi:hypothetical protein CcaverHIS002_0103450 [Cutaneotrichosporon cavernicola]|nr:hypothetical protein CcaverHIS002_0103450 [Cutaneotrichosporon cavernicola]BEJ03166.1 hypothetical protein CcaverHIS641_0103410 [Cutaneotrichosporon cavernicola]